MNVIPNFQQKRVPTLLGLGGLLLLLTALTLTTKGIGAVRQLFSSADQGSIPKNVEVVNVTDSSFAVYWLTDNDNKGAVFFGKTNSLGDGVAVDERDLTSPNGQYKTHFVRVSNLTENSKYFFKVASGSFSFGPSGNSGLPYTVTTGPRLLQAAAQIDPVFGKVFNSDSTPATGAISVWSSPGATKIAALVKSDGTFVLPISFARSQDLSAIIKLTLQTPEKIVISSPVGEATINCFIGTNDRPLPDVKIGDVIDCTGNSGRIATPSGKIKLTTTSAATSVLSQSAGFLAPAKQNLLISSSGSAQINITEGQSLLSTYPTISGKAGPYEVVKIVIHSATTYSGTVIAGADGSWSWTPPAGLSPGEHTVTITIVNPDGSTQTVSRNFSVVVGQPILPITSGTPSAEPTPVATPTPRPVTPPQTGSTENSVLLLTFGLILFTLSIMGSLKFLKNGS